MRALAPIYRKFDHRVKSPVKALDHESIIELSRTDKKFTVQNDVLITTRTVLLHDLANDPQTKYNSFVLTLDGPIFSYRTTREIMRNYCNNLPLNFSQIRFCSERLSNNKQRSPLAFGLLAFLPCGAYKKDSTSWVSVHHLVKTKALANKKVHFRFGGHVAYTVDYGSRDVYADLKLTRHIGKLIFLGIKIYGEQVGGVLIPLPCTRHYFESLNIDPNCQCEYCEQMPFNSKKMVEYRTEFENHKIAKFIETARSFIANEMASDPEMVDYFTALLVPLEERIRYKLNRDCTSYGSSKSA